MFQRITNWFKNWGRSRQVKKARAAWVKALRSDEYAQGRDSLCKVNADGEHYCCLGVGCEVFQKLTNHKFVINVVDGSKYYGDDSGTLPREVAEFFDITSHGHLPPSDGAFSEGALTDLNDNERKTFEQIADVIESGNLLPFNSNCFGNIWRPNKVTTHA